MCVCGGGGGEGGEELDLCVNIVMSKSLSTCTLETYVGLVTEEDGTSFICLIS